MDLPDFLTQHPGGEIRLRGHRVSLFHLLDAYRTGASPEELHAEYPTVPLSLVRQALDFYRVNRVEVDAYLAEYSAELDRQEQNHAPSNALLRLRQRANQNGPSSPSGSR